MHDHSPKYRGRGSAINPANRFERNETLADEYCDAPLAAPATRYIADDSASIISTNESPDVGFAASLNPYRGCEHGCAYCYARPSHEYLGYSGGLDFESIILYKPRAAALLNDTLRKPSWKPQVLVMSGITDPYQPAEKKFRITRQCLEVLLECRHPIGVITKNYGIVRDLDVLGALAAKQLCSVTISITTLDPSLTAVLEPRSSRPERRLAAIRALSDAGIPVNVNVAPVIPGLNDHEMPGILEAAAAAGAQTAAYIVLRLPLVVAPVFEHWLEVHRPLSKNKILGRIQDLRNGKLNAAAFGERMRGQGVWAETYRLSFASSCKRLGLNKRYPVLRTDLFRRPANGQYHLFD